MNVFGCMAGFWFVGRSSANSPPQLNLVVRRMLRVENLLGAKIMRGCAKILRIGGATHGQTSKGILQNYRSLL